MGFLYEVFANAFELIIKLDPELINITGLSLKVSGSAVVLSSIVGIPLAALISFWNFRGRQFIATVINTLMGLPPVLVGLLVYLLLSRSGPLGEYRLLFNPSAMVIAQFILVTPIIAGISISALNSVDKKIWDTAFSLGGTKTDIAAAIIKEARLGIVTAVIAGLGRAIAEVGAIIMVGGNIRWHTRALTTAIVLEVQMGNFSKALALGIILMTLAFALNLLVNTLQRRRLRSVNY